MSSRITQFFMMPQEYELMLEAAKQEGLIMAFARRDDDRFVKFNGPRAFTRLALGKTSTLVLVSTSGNSEWLRLTRKEVDAARMGLASGIAPSLDDGVLFMSEFGSKSDWLDSKSGVVRENGASHQVLSSLRKILRPLLHGWVSMSGETGQRARICRGLGYSAGVLDFARSGGVLKQRGVDRIKFFIPD